MSEKNLSIKFSKFPNKASGSLWRTNWVAIFRFRLTIAGLFLFIFFTPWRKLWKCSTELSLIYAHICYIAIHICCLLNKMLDWHQPPAAPSNVNLLGRCSLYWKLAIPHTISSGRCNKWGEKQLSSFHGRKIGIPAWKYNWNRCCLSEFNTEVSTMCFLTLLEM